MATKKKSPKKHKRRLASGKVIWVGGGTKSTTKKTTAKKAGPSTKGKSKTGKPSNLTKGSSVPAVKKAQAAAAKKLGQVPGKTLKATKSKSAAAKAAVRKAKSKSATPATGIHHGTKGAKMKGNKTSTKKMSPGVKKPTTKKRQVKLTTKQNKGFPKSGASTMVKKARSRSKSKAKSSRVVGTK